MSLFQIGPEVFTTLSRPDRPDGGMPEIRTEQTRVEFVDGLDGVSIPKLGTKGLPFQLQSFRDCASELIAAQRVSAYRQMCAKEWGVIWKGINMLSRYDTTHVVLAVGQFVIREVRNGIGGVSGTATHVVEAMWTLIATEPSA